MLGKGVETDSDLARAAAQGDEDAFGRLFENHLTAVFVTAWRVLNDRWAAAEVTYETFAEAWRHRAEIAVDMWGQALVEMAHHRARGWLGAHPEAVERAEQRDAAKPPPSLGPTLRARVISALQAQQVPTGTLGSETVTTGSMTTTGSTPAHLASSSSEGGGAGRLVAGTRGRVIAALASVGVLLAVGLAVDMLNGGGSDNTRTDGGQVDAPSSTVRDDEQAQGSAEASSAHGKRGSSTTATSSSTTSSSSTSSTTSSSTTTTEPAPTTTAPDQAPPPPPPTQPSTTTTRPPQPPRITYFDGHFYDYNGNACSSPQELLSIRWETQNATGGRIRREGGQWMNLPQSQLNSGGFDVCSRFGTTWYLEVWNSVDNDTDEFEEWDVTHT